MHPYFLTHLTFGAVVRRHVQVTGLEGLEKDRPYIIAANHIDWLDGVQLAFIFAGALQRRVFFIARSKNYRLYRSTLTIDQRKSDSVVPGAIAAIRRGYPVCVFIEGQRNTTGSLARPHSGAVRIALASGVPVLPVGVRGPAGKSFWESIQLAWRNREQFRVTIGQPYRLQAGEDVTAATRRLGAEVAALCGKEFHH